MSCVASHVNRGNAYILLYFAEMCASLLGLWRRHVLTEANVLPKCFDLLPSVPIEHVSNGAFAIVVKIGGHFSLRVDQWGVAKPIFEIRPLQTFAAVN